MSDQTVKRIFDVIKDVLDDADVRRRITEKWLESYQSPISCDAQTTTPVIQTTPGSDEPDAKKRRLKSKYFPCIVKLESPFETHKGIPCIQFVTNAKE